MTDKARYRVILSHYGSKRGGWDVRWYLETCESDLFKTLVEKVNLLPPEKALGEFGFKISDISWPYLGPFPTKEEALKKAAGLGLETISRTKWGMIRRGASL